MTDQQPQNQDALIHLLHWLSPDSEQAGRRYVSLRRKLMELLARRGAPTFALDELADKTLDRAGRKLADGEVIHQPEPMAYLHGVARNVLSEYWREQARKLGEHLFEDSSPRGKGMFEAQQYLHEEKQELERWLKCLDEFLKSLPPEEQTLLRNCYHDDAQQQAANRRAEAQRLNLEEGSLRARLYRICQTLKPKVRACVERRQK